MLTNDTRVAGIADDIDDFFDDGEDMDAGELDETELPGITGHLHRETDPTLWCWSRSARSSPMPLRGPARGDLPRGPRHQARHSRRHPHQRVAGLAIPLPRLHRSAAPGRGTFFDNRGSATTLLSYGEVRENDFVRPLAAGHNLVAGGYPVAASPSSRRLTLAAGLFGSLDFKTADSIFLWKPDEDPAAKGYETYWLASGAPAQPAFLRWVRIGDASATPRDDENLLPMNRSAFIRTKDPHPDHRTPAPWTP